MDLHEQGLSQLHFSTQFQKTMTVTSVQYYQQSQNTANDSNTFKSRQVFSP